MRLDRRGFIAAAASTSAAFGLGGCLAPASRRLRPGAFRPTPATRLLNLDMVHHNPGEALTRSAFTDPRRLDAWGYDGQVVNDYIFFQTAATFDTLDRTVFPAGTLARRWVLRRAERIDAYIAACKAAGVDCYVFTDIIVLPRRIKELYGDAVTDAEGRFTLEKPRTVEIHESMLDELFQRFPGLTGLVVRTGETYLHNTPHHLGNGPVRNGDPAEKIIRNHAALINLLRRTACEKYGKTIIYRTWAPGGLHTDADLYLAVAERVPPHPGLYFSIKHTDGDFHRTFGFNPTIGIGRHQQLVEVQCQREYEGKGAHPNYVMDGVINGFEEYRDDGSPDCLDDLTENPNFAGVFSWSRGGGWKGPYISNELWCSLNAYVISGWTQAPERTEAAVFDEFCSRVLGLGADAARRFRRLCLLSAQGVLRGRSSLVVPVNSWWIRDEFMGGIIPEHTPPSDDVELARREGWGKLNETLDYIVDRRLVERALGEKEEAVRIWWEIERLAGTIAAPDLQTQDYIEVSSTYGRIKYEIVERAWAIMLHGLQGDRDGRYDKAYMASAISDYDRLWDEFRALKANNRQCATLYKPYGFVYRGPDYHGEYGMQHTVDHYRNVVS